MKGGGGFGPGLTPREAEPDPLRRGSTDGSEGAGASPTRFPARDHEAQALPKRSWSKRG